MHLLVNHVAGEQDVRGFVLRVTADPGVLAQARGLTRSLARGEDIPGPCREACRALGVADSLLRDRLWALAALLPDGADADGPWQILGVGPGSDLGSVRSAFRRLCLECHPDHNQGDPLAAERFQRIKTAYDMVSKAFEESAPQVREAHARAKPAATSLRPSAWSRVRHLAPLGLVVALLLLAVGTIDPLVRRLRPAFPHAGVKAPARPASAMSGVGNGTAPVSFPRLAKRDALDWKKADRLFRQGMVKGTESVPVDAPPVIGGEERLRELLSQRSPSPRTLSEVSVVADGPTFPLNGEGRLRAALAQEHFRQGAGNRTMAVSPVATPDRRLADLAISKIPVKAMVMLPDPPPDSSESASTRTVASGGLAAFAGGERTTGQAGEGSAGHPHAPAALAPVAPVREVDGNIWTRNPGPDSPRRASAGMVKADGRGLFASGERTSSLAGEGSAGHPQSSAALAPVVPVREVHGKIWSRNPGPDSSEHASAGIGEAEGLVLFAHEERVSSQAGEVAGVIPRVPSAMALEAPSHEGDVPGRNAPLQARQGGASERLVSFLAGYAQDYSRRDLKAFMAHFTPDAVENGVPISLRLPEYTETFDAMVVTEYRIEIVQWAMAGGDVLLEGRFTLRGVRDAREILSRGILCMDLVSAGRTFLVRSLSYSFQ